MLAITNKGLCCGCAACVQVCPKQCITMQADKEGFDYPAVNTAGCINCGLCEKVCPIQNTDRTDAKAQPQAYVAYAKAEDMRLNSSSGGIFTLLAEKILEKHGIVFGVAFDAEFMAHHIAIQRTDDIALLRGSKYIQSRVEKTFQEAKEYLDQGRFVLYSGTACQIAGLKCYLRKDYDNLCTIDVLCHGTPSPKLWKKYLVEQEKMHNAATRRTFFRHKKYGWKTYAVLLEYSNNTAYECVFTKDAFMQMFLSNICLRPSCYECRFKLLDRPSDITLGDCWGIERYMPEMDDDKGTSVVLVHTKKGEKLLESISDGAKFAKADLDRALPPNADSRKSVSKHMNRARFFNDLNQNRSIAELLKLTKLNFFQKCWRKLSRSFKMGD